MLRNRCWKRWIWCVFCGFSLMSRIVRSCLDRSLSRVCSLLVFGSEALISMVVDLDYRAVELLHYMFFVAWYDLVAFVVRGCELVAHCESVERERDQRC